MKLLKKPYLILILCCAVCHAEADDATNHVTQTQSQLQQLETKIQNLQQKLHRTHDKHGLLNQELAQIEKKTNESFLALRAIQQAIASKEQRIAHLQQTIEEQNEQLHTQQQRLAKYIRTRYTMGEHQPIKWLLNQDNPYTTSRVLTFYEYLIRAYQTTIEETRHIQQKLDNTHKTLKHDLLAQQQLQQKLHLRQTTLKHQTTYHKTILQALDNDILTQQKALEEYEHNKQNLKRLLANLTQHSLMQRQYPLMYLNKKLPWPVSVERNKLQKIHQGVIFFAREGSPVIAVYPGKVVFSDWLKGYGLLLILDHGQGFMTLYAHNQSLFKQQGEQVNQGEQIAATGHTGGIKQNGLYFEIRQRGKAISPLRWLS